MNIKAKTDAGAAAPRSPWWRAWRRFSAAAWLFGAAASGAQACTGLMLLRPPALAEPVTVAYSTTAPDANLVRGPFTVRAAVDAPPARGNGRLVVLSHGSGGSVWPQFDLAQTLVASGFTVAMPLHEDNNFQSQRDIGPVSRVWRLQEVSVTIDAVAAEPRLAPLQLDLQCVGLYGMSAGGITALPLAGARWATALLARHCDAHIEQDFATCAGLTTRLTGGALDGTQITVARQFVQRKHGSDATWRQHTDPRIQAVAAAVPMAVPIDFASLAQPRVPLALVRAEKDA